MKDKETTIESIGYDTIENQEFFKCKKCGDEYILKGFVFCPNCGRKINYASEGMK
ncbi:hypothetical protein [Bacteroides sp.]|uniref:hypothetical protein n=1 Tax=Bacteroides sp. TaxID=29523 RepID=UPI0026084BB6|nr:hypothetical protein [Bacteroides sp.]MDD3040524.1 hypothetical protein [Bacteroides sp.]